MDGRIGWMVYLMEEPGVRHSNGCYLGDSVDVLALFLKRSKSCFQIQFHKIGHALLPFKKTRNDIVQDIVQDIVLQKSERRSTSLPIHFGQIAGANDRALSYLLALPL